MAQGKVVVVGGHGKVALLTAPKLIAAGYSVDSLIRNPDHIDDVAATGAQPVVLDLETADVDMLSDAFEGAVAIVFSAGAGGGDPERTRAVDHDAALRTMAAATRAGVDRYVMVSYAGAEVDIDEVDTESPFYPYARAKHQADAHLRTTELDWTILGPGALTLEPGTGRVRVIDVSERRDHDPSTSRENVASAITHVLVENAGVHRTINFYDGDTPLADAFA